MRIYYPGGTRQHVLKKLQKLDYELAEASRRLHVPIIAIGFVHGFTAGFTRWFGLEFLLAGLVATLIWVDWSFDRWAAWFTLRRTRKAWAEFLAELERED